MIRIKSHVAGAERKWYYMLADIEENSEVLHGGNGGFIQHLYLQFLSKFTIELQGQGAKICVRF